MTVYQVITVITMFAVEGVITAITSIAVDTLIAVFYQGGIRYIDTIIRVCEDSFTIHTIFYFSAGVAQVGIFHISRMATVITVYAIIIEQCNQGRFCQQLSKIFSKRLTEIVLSPVV